MSVHRSWSVCYHGYRPGSDSTTRHVVLSDYITHTTTISKDKEVFLVLKPCISLTNDKKGRTDGQTT